MSNKLKTAVTHTASGLIAACMGFGLMVTTIGAHAAPATSVKSEKVDGPYLLSLTAIPVTGQSPADALKAAGFTNIVSEPDGLLRATEGVSGVIDVGADIDVATIMRPLSRAGIVITPETIAGKALSDNPVIFSNQYALGYISGISNSCTKSAEPTLSKLTDGVHGIASMNAAHEVGLQIESSSATLNDTSVECPHGANEVFQLPVVASRKETFHLSVAHGNHDSVALPGFWPLNGASTVFVVTLKPMDVKK